MANAIMINPISSEYDDFLLKALANELTGDIVIPSYITKISPAYFYGWFMANSTSITSITIPNTITTYSTARIFSNSNLKIVRSHLPQNNVPNDFTYNNPLLEKVIIESDSGLASTSLYMCENNVSLYALVLKPNRLITCGWQNFMFNGCTQFITEGGTGRIYVPRALLSQYQAHSSWSNFSDRFLAMEDYPEICEL